MKKYIFVFISLLLFLFLAIPILALANGRPTNPEPRTLEVEYPRIESEAAPETVKTGIPNYVKYIYYFIIGISGLIGLGVIIIAGIRYLTSAGIPEKLKDARQQISSALLGILILLCSWLILNTINPQLTVLPEPGELPLLIPRLKPGVLLCKDWVKVTEFWYDKKIAENQEIAYKAREEKVKNLYRILKQINDNCYWTGGTENIREDFQGLIRYVFLIPDLLNKKQYGAILYGAENQIKIMYEDKDGLEQPSEWLVPQEFGASSTKPFILNYEPSPTWYVKLYQSILFNRDKETSEGACWAIEPLLHPSQEPFCSLLYPAGDYGKTAVYFPDLTAPLGFEPLYGIGTQEIGSIEIEGDLIIIFFRDVYDPENSDRVWNAIDVITKPGDSDLNNNLMGIWNPRCYEPQPDWFDRDFPCANNMLIISGSFF